jgi:hypothetical protein
MDLDRAYVDVAVMRWEQLTGEPALLEGESQRCGAEGRAGRLMPSLTVVP